MNNEKIFIELLNSLNNDKELFLSGILHTEREFLDNIHKLQKYITHLQDTQIREKVTKFVNSIVNSKNYSIILQSIEEDKIKKEKQELARQKRLNEKQKTIQKQKEEQEKILNLISIINTAIDNKKYEEAVSLYKNNCNNIAVHNFDYWVNISQKMDIMEFILKRKIKKLIHFTNINNLECILKIGIIPRTLLDEKNIIYKPTDEKRFDGRPDCSCVSIEYPNFKMLHYKKNGSSNIYVMIVLDAGAILLNNIKKYYVYINAANSNATYQLTSDRLSNIKYLKNMFLPRVSDTKCTYEREDSDPDFITTNPQAEILINGKIDTHDILEIHFANQNDFDYFKRICIDKTIFDKYKFVVNDFYFNKDRELVKWEER